MQILVPDGVLSDSADAVKNCPQSIKLQIGFDMSLSIVTTSGTDVTSQWRTGAGGVGDTVRIRATTSHGRALKVYSAIAPTAPTYSNAFYQSSISSYNVPLAAGVTGANVWTLDGSNAYQEYEISLTSQAPGQYRYALLDGIFEDVNGARNVGYMNSGYPLTSSAGTVPGIGNSGSPPLVDLKIGFIIATRGFTIGTTAVASPTQWQDPTKVISYTMSASNAYFKAAYVSLASNIPALDDSTNAAAGVQMTVAPTVGAGYIGINASEVLSTGATGTTTIAINYTITPRLNRWAGVYTLTIPQGKYDNGLTGGALVANAPMTDQLNIGFRPTVAVYPGSAGTGAVITDNRFAAAFNRWVSKTAFDDGSGTISIKVAAPAACDALGSDQGVYSLLASIPAFTTGGLFTGSAVPSFSYLSPSSGTSTLSSTGTGGASGYVYPVNIASASVVSGKYVITLAQGAVTSAASGIGNYPVTITLQVGWDPLLSIRGTSGGSNVTDIWLSPAGTAYLRVENLDSTVTGTLRDPTLYTPISDNCFAASNTPTFPLSNLADTPVRGGATSYWLESALTLTSVTPGSYFFTILDGTLLDANQAGVVGGQRVQLKVGFVITPVVIVDNSTTWTTAEWYDGTRVFDLQLTASEPYSSAMTTAVGNAPTIGGSASSGFNVASSPTAATGITAVTGVWSSATTVLSYMLDITAATSASTYTISVNQGTYQNNKAANEFAMNAAPAPIALRIGFKPTLQVFQGSSGSAMVCDSVSLSNHWISRTALPAGSSGAGHIRLSVIPANTQSVSSLASIGNAPPWGSTPAGALFDSLHGGAVPSLSNGNTVFITSSAVTPSGSSAGYTYDVNIASTTPGWYRVALPEGVVQDVALNVRNCPTSLVIQIGFDLTVTVRDAASVADETMVWHTGSSGPITDTVTLRMRANEAALSTIGNYTSLPAAPTYTNVFYNAPIAGSGAWTAPDTSTYELAVPLTTYAPGQYVYKIKEGAFKDANGAANVGFLNDGSDPTGSSSGAVTAPLSKVTLLVGFRTDVTFEQNAVPIAVGQWIDPDQTIASNSLLNAVLTISNGAGSYDSGYPTSSPTFSSLFTISSSPSVSSNGIISGGALVRGNNTVVRYHINTDYLTSSSTYTFATTQGALCNSQTVNSNQICNAAASNVLKVGWKPVIELVMGNATMGSATYTITSTASSGNNFWVSRTNVGADNGGHGVVTVRVRPPSIQGVSALSTSGIPTWAASGGALFDSARHTAPGAFNAVVPNIVDSSSTLTLRSSFVPATSATHYLYELDVSSNVPAPYAVSSYQNTML